MILLERPPQAGILPGYRWRQGDRLARIGRTPIRDILDFYYLAEEEGTVEVIILDADDRSQRHRLSTRELTTFSQTFAPLEFKTCAARCVFCFIDQNPPGLRETIYVKDEDYRLSFLYGNYITLTSMGRRGIERVLEQHLSPLYVSVHATDVETRTRLLGIARRMDVMGVLRLLTGQGIRVHAQIVLCPGWNDGDVLDRTLEDLGTLRPGLESVAVVPVGLSDHRQGLTDLRPVTVEDARRAVRQVEAWGERFLAETGTRLAYASDELYLRAERPLPPLDFYGSELPQHENGVGMCASALHETQELLAELRRIDPGPTTVTVLTGTLAAGFFERHVRPVLDPVPWLDLRVVGVPNRLFGRGITVAGLLSGRDFQAALQTLPSDAGTVLIPPSALNHDRLFLDDTSLDELRAAAPHPLQVPDAGLAEALASLAGARP